LAGKLIKKGTVPLVITAKLFAPGTPADKSRVEL
jgi:hypothetical protein